MLFALRAARSKLWAAMHVQYTLLSQLCLYDLSFGAGSYVQFSKSYIPLCTRIFGFFKQLGFYVLPFTASIKSKEKAEGRV